MTDRSDERLAAYVSGDLTPDERASLEDELTGDPDLRARVEAIRAADEALAGLPDPQPSGAFSERLRAAVDDELDRQLGDELARRRARRARRDWTPLAAAAAAAIIVLGGVGIAVTTLGGEDADTTAESAQTRAFDAGEAGPAARSDEPVILASGRDYDEDAVRELLAGAALSEISERSLDPAGADRLAAQYRSSFGLGDDAIEEEAGTAESLEAPADDSAGGDGDATDGAAPAPPSASALALPGLSAEEAADVRRCLPELLATEGRTVIPVYAEVASFDGQPAIVYGLVSDGPEGAASRTEVWVVSRGPDCRTLYFTQDG